ncbi:ER membrane protein SH3 [Mucor mucedo]|nr:ER membrane protein SH3 [Mucor mucedo]KAI7896436.1 ER membrane protein SH3 [Mucor mucedo]
MGREAMQTAKVALVLCSCFFSYGTYWSDWAFDYYLLWANPLDHPEAISRAAFYYANQAHIPSILKYVPIANLCIATAGFVIGLFTMTDGNLLFDGASLVLMFFGLSTYVTSVRPAIATVNESSDLNDITTSLKNIAAAHFIIVLSITGIIGLQIAHYLIMKKTSKDDEDSDEDEDEQEEEDKKNM